MRWMIDIRPDDRWLMDDGWTPKITGSNGMFMYKIIQYLLFGHINLVRIFSIQHRDTTDGTYNIDRNIVTI